MRILITGANSLLGKSLWENVPKNYQLLLSHLPKQNIKAANAKTTLLDVTDKKQVLKVAKSFRPNIIIHLAALSNVDFCQAHPRLALQVNVKGTKNIIDACNNFNSKLIFTSTNGIFNGKNPPYNEKSTPHPIHTYGQSKLEAEKIIKKSGIPSLTTRLVTMYGWKPPKARHNPVTWLFEELKQGKTLTMVTDIYANPLFAPSAAEAIWKLIEKKALGTYHIAGKTSVNRYQWTQKTAKIFGFKKASIKPTTSTSFQHLTTRPKNTTLSSKKLERTIKWKPLSLSQGLLRMYISKKS